MRIEDNFRGLVEHRGPHFEHWRRRCLAAFGVLPVDEAGDEG